MIVLENVCKTYRMGETIVSALRDVSLRIEEGEFVSIIGSSGSGKSTLLHILGLLDRPTSGSLRIAGREASGLDDDALSRLRSETIGFVFQQFHLLKRITAEENVALPLIYAKGGEGEGLRPPADPAVLLKHVGIGHRGDHKPNELSGGQQQRVAIARALVRRPTLILADEPTGNLDSKSGAEIMALFRTLHAQGLTIILVTHEPSIAALADRTIRMHDGQKVEDIRNPRKEAVSAAAAAAAQEAIAPAAAPGAHLHPPRWHLFLTGLQQAFASLWANKLRAALSALGIIIGVGAVIVMLALGSAAQKSVGTQIAALGSNRLTVFANPQQTGGVRMQAGAVTRITLDETLEIEKRIPQISAVTGGVAGGVQAVYRANNVYTQVRGALPGYQAIYDARPIYGRFFTLDECTRRARVAVLGTTVLTGLFGDQNPVGQTILINHIPFTVLGVLPPKGADGTNDLDDRIVIPLQTAMFRVLGRRYVDWIDTTTATPEDLPGAQAALLDLTREWPHIPGVTSDSYRVIDMSGVAKALKSVTDTLSVMLASVAAISLVVGGIGIMNTMLISVTERTREIGLRKALGARGRDIRLQFLIESVALCLIGGGLGIVAGTAATLVVGYFHGTWLFPTFLSIFLSCGFSIGVGVGFGYWPAVRAARLDPITALRQE